MVVRGIRVAQTLPAISKEGRIPVCVTLAWWLTVFPPRVA